MKWLFLGNILCSEMCFVWYKYSHSNLPLVNVGMLFFPILLLLSSFVSLYLRYIFCRQHIAVYCFFTQFDNLCLLNWAVYMITFNVIINTVRFESYCLAICFLFVLSVLGSPVSLLSACFGTNWVLFMIPFCDHCRLINSNSLLWYFCVALGFRVKTHFFTLLIEVKELIAKDSQDPK